MSYFILVIAVCFQVAVNMKSAHPQEKSAVLIGLIFTQVARLVLGDLLWPKDTVLNWLVQSRALE